MDERRKYERTATSIRVEMKNPAFGSIIGFANDISDGGAQVTIENHPILPTGTQVEVLFRKAIGRINKEPVKMNVIYTRKNVIGLMFVH